jgi:flagellar hook protein FlgE
MANSLFAAVSGLNAQQTWLDVVAQNIANVNTVAYKSSRVTFAEVMQQTLRGASAPTAAVGGVNPEQIGAGGAVNVGSIDVNMSQGSIQSTGINTDLALQGDGFFVVKGSQGVAYTRAGNFYLDANGNLVTATGDFVQGWLPNAQGAINTSPTNLSNLTIVQGEAMPPQATTSITYAGNLNAADPAGTVLDVPVTVYDSLGNPEQVTIQLTPGGTPDTWTVSYNGTQLGTLTFSTSGTLTSSTVGPITLTPTGAQSPQTITLNFNQVTQYSATDSIQALSQNGFGSGELTGFTINPDGTITGTFSNGQTQVLGQVAVAVFNNEDGLQKLGNNLWGVTNNSGQAQVGVAGTGGRGTVQSGALEGSNVDLGTEFVNLIMAQQGYQANAKVISVAQILLQTVTNMVQP